MLVREIMTKGVKLLSPEDSIQQAACHMRDEGIGSLPIASGDRLIGYVTDRDIVVRGVAAGKELGCPVYEVMTKNLFYCFEDEEVEAVAENMATNQVRRLPVLTRAMRLCGIISLGDLATKSDDGSTEVVLSEISEPKA